MFSLTHYRALFKNAVIKIPTDIYRDEENKAWLVNLNNQTFTFSDSDSKDSPELSLFLAKKLLIHHHYTKPRKVLASYIRVLSVDTSDHGVSLIGEDTYGDPVYTNIVIMANRLEPSTSLIEVIDIDNCAYISLLPKNMLNALAPYLSEE